MADQLPNATLVGLDSSANQIAAGRRLLESARLQNVQLQQADILDYSPEPSSFDYIICHGVYSWVPAQIQKRILEICSTALSPNGIAYISYNTYPGWRMRGMIRDIMRYRASFFESPQQQLSQARGLLAFLSESVASENNPYGMLLKSELDAVRAADDSYLFHEHLEEVNEPIYFHQFVSQAAMCELQYLGEADFGVMSIESFSEPVRAMLQGVCRNVIETEQYMDFLRNRMFRQTLLCRSTVPLARTVSPQSILTLEVATNTQPEGDVDIRSEGRVTYRRGTSQLTTTDPVVKAAIEHLRHIWPRSAPFLELAAIARSIGGGTVAAVQTDSMSPATQRLADALLRCVATGQIDLHGIGPKFVTTVGSTPTSSALARIQAQIGSRVTNLRHSSVNLDDFQRQLLILCDGSRGERELLQEMAEKVREGGVLLHAAGRRVETPDETHSILSQHLPPTLDSLARLALLVS